MENESHKENHLVISKQVSLFMPRNKKSTRFCVADCFVRLLLLGYYRNLPHTSIKFALITPYKFSVASITRLLWRGFVIFPKISLKSTPNYLTCPIVQRLLKEGRLTTAFLQVQMKIFRIF